MSTYLKSSLIPSYYLPKLFSRPVMLDDIIEIRDDGVAAKLLSKVKDENGDKPKPYFTKVTKKEYDEFLASNSKRTEVQVAMLKNSNEQKANTAPAVDPATRVSSEGESVLTKDSDDAAKAEETAKAALVNTLQAVADKPTEEPAKPVAKAVTKPAAKPVARKAPAKPQRKAK